MRFIYFERQWVPFQPEHLHENKGWEIFISGQNKEAQLYDNRLSPNQKDAYPFIFFADLYPPIDQEISRKTKGVLYFVHRASRTRTLHVAMENKALMRKDKEPIPKGDLKPVKRKGLVAGIQSTENSKNNLISIGQFVSETLMENPEISEYIK